MAGARLNGGKMNEESISVNTPVCDKCKKEFLWCQCSQNFEKLGEAIRAGEKLHSEIQAKQLNWMVKNLVPDAEVFIEIKAKRHHIKLAYHITSSKDYPRGAVILIPEQDSFEGSEAPHVKGCLCAACCVID